MVLVELVLVVDEEALDFVGGFEGFFLLGGGGEVDDDLGGFGDDALELMQWSVGFGNDFGDHEGG